MGRGSAQGKPIAQEFLGLPVNRSVSQYISQFVCWFVSQIFSQIVSRVIDSNLMANQAKFSLVGQNIFLRYCCTQQPTQTRSCGAHMMETRTNGISILLIVCHAKSRSLPLSLFFFSHIVLILLVFRNILDQFGSHGRPLDFWLLHIATT